MLEGDALAKQIIEEISQLTVVEGSLRGQPFTVLPWEREFIYGMCANPVSILTIGRGNGKALCLDTPVPTPRGWTTMGKLEAGDLVYGSTGEPTKVLHAFDVTHDRPCYAVEFDTGDKIIADADHQWLTHKRHLRPKGGYDIRKGPKGWRHSVSTTAEIADSLYLSDERYGPTPNHSIDIAGPLVGRRDGAPARTSLFGLPVHPYVLGAWLGDGNSDMGYITCADEDSEIIKNIEAEGYRIKRKQYNGRAPNWTIYKLSVQLRDLGVLNNKHIPDFYLSASYRDRMALLQGIVDTDGHVMKHGHQVEVTTVSKRLAEGYVELIRSLGFKCPMPPARDAKLNGEVVGPRYRVMFPHKGYPVARLKRKAARICAYQPRVTTRRHYITACYPVPSVPVRCITVDAPDSLYLAGKGLIPTHNSQIIAAIATTAITPGGALYEPMRDIIIVSASLTQAAVIFKRILSHMDERIEADREEARAAQERDPWSIQNSTQKRAMTYRPDKTELHLVGCDPKLAHGYAAGLFIGDEPAQWQHGNEGEEMRNALKGALGKQDNARLVFLGTKAQRWDHWWNQMLDDEDAGFRTIYAADREDDDFNLETVAKANPSMSHIPSLQKQILSDMKQAEKGIDLLYWRAQRLNKGTPEVEKFGPIVEMDYWDDITREKMAPREGPVFVGIDFGGSMSMSAVCFYWPQSGRYEAHAALPKSPSLDERGKRDKVGNRYVEMHKRGELRLYSGHSTNNAHFLADMLKEIEGEEIGGMAADTWKQSDLAQALSASGLYHLYDDIDLRRVGHGEQGSADVRGFQAEVLESASRDADSGSLFHCNDNLLMRSAIAEAMVIYDTNGNPKLDKARSRGRIDALQAGIMAVSMGRTWRMPPDGGLDEFWRQLASSDKPAVSGY